MADRKLLCSYRVESGLGRWGMGSGYRAHDPDLLFDAVFKLMSKKRNMIL